MSVRISFQHPGPEQPAIIRNTRVVEISKTQQARSEVTCVKLADETGPAEYDLTLYVHSWLNVDEPDESQTL